MNDTETETDEVWPDERWTVTDHVPVTIPPDIDTLRNWSTLRLVRLRERVAEVLGERSAQTARAG